MNLPTPYKYALGYIMLPVEGIFDHLPDHISVNGKELQKKDSFHVSLVCVKDMIERIIAEKKTDPVKTENEILRIFFDYVARTPIRFESFRDEFRYAIKGEKETIVVRCGVSGLAGLFKLYRDCFKVDIPDQPTHITLYTLQPNAAIGINSPEAMERYQKVAVPEIKL